MIGDSETGTASRRTYRHLICTANFLLTAAMVMQIAAFIVFATDMGLNVRTVSLTNLSFVFGMLMIGPFGAYLTDKYRRKSVYIISLFLAAVVCCVLFLSVNIASISATRLFEGMMYGLAQISLGSTLLNDLAESDTRTSADYSYVWAAMLALPSGALVSVCLVRYIGLDILLWVTIIMLLLSAMIVARLKVPFRAPVRVAVVSLDRFWQKDDFIPFLNLMLLSVGVGALVDILLSSELLAWAGMGVVIARLVRKALFRNADVRAEMIVGLVLICFAILIFMLHDTDVSQRMASCMVGIGFSLSSTRFLLYFLKLTGHCQRGTAQNTYLLSRECGYALGFIAAFMLQSPSSLALALILLAIVMYLFVTHPWFLRHNDRYFKFREV